MKLFPVIADSWKMDGGVIFGVVPRSIWENLYPVDSGNMVPFVNRCLLVDNGSRRILIETGMGRKQKARYYELRGVEEESRLLQGLAELGYSPGDITDVVFTHLHDDHVGGAVSINGDNKPQLLFPGADHWCSAAQWKWALEPNKREAATYLPVNLEPLRDRMRFIEEGTLFADGIRFEIHNGHTMGQLIPFITEGDETYVYTADFIPLHVNVHVPFVASVDIQPLVAMEEKQHFLDLAAERGYTLIYEHDSVVEASKVEITDKGFRAGKPIRLSNRI